MYQSTFTLPYLTYLREIVLNQKSPWFMLLRTKPEKKQFLERSESYQAKS